jgi:predicted Fe-Mo cluster-binding NifX family protein
MMLCIPITKDEGLQSPLSAHFGSAPFFLLVDGQRRVLRTIPNQSLVHAHGQCQPLAALGGAQVDAIVVGGIGAGALAGIRAAGVDVLWSDGGTVEETLAQLAGPGLRRILPAQTCGHRHHGQPQGEGGGCHH